MARAVTLRVPETAVPKPKVIWLHPADLLPRVSPKQAATDRTRSIVRDERLIRTNPRTRKRADQFTHVPAPKPEPRKEVPSRSAVLVEPVPQPPPAPAPPAPKKFVAPPMSRPPDPQPQPTIEAPPQIAIRANPEKVNLPIPAGEITVSKPPPKQFVPPPVRSQKAGQPSQLITEGIPGAPAPTAAATPSGEAVAAIISRNLLDSDRVVRPEANRPARIETGGLGKTKGPDAGSGLVVPGVTIRDNRSPTAVVQPAPVAAPKAEPPAVPRAAPRPRLDTPTISVPQRPQARRVPPEVDMVFAGRVVYSTVMASTPGGLDWVLWFGEAQPRPPGARSVMRPPVLESLPQAIAALSAANGAKSWVLAKLDKTGTLADIKALPGSSAIRPEDVSKLLFSPAVRNGEPVDVDLLIEAGRISEPAR